MNTGRNCSGKRRTTCSAFAAALASAVVVLGGAGCSTAQPSNVRRDTAEITEALQAKFFRDARFSTGTSVKVNPGNGIVTLSGRVATDADLEVAGKLAELRQGRRHDLQRDSGRKPGP